MSGRSGILKQIKHMCTAAEFMSGNMSQSFLSAAP